MAHQKNLRSQLDRNSGLSTTTQAYTHTHKTTEEISSEVPICSCLKASNNEDDSQQQSHPSETMSEEILIARKARKGVMLQILGTWLADYKWCCMNGLSTVSLPLATLKYSKFPLGKNLLAF